MSSQKIKETKSEQRASGGKQSKRPPWNAGLSHDFLSVTQEYLQRFDKKMKKRTRRPKTAGAIKPDEKSPSSRPKTSNALDQNRPTTALHCSGEQNKGSKIKVCKFIPVITVSTVSVDFEAIDLGTEEVPTSTSQLVAKTVTEKGEEASSVTPHQLSLDWVPKKEMAKNQSRARASRPSSSRASRPSSGVSRLSGSRTSRPSSPGVCLEEGSTKDISERRPRWRY